MDLTTPRLTVPVSERDHSKGPLEAKAVIVEYGDYECPHCRLVHHDIKAVQKHLDERICYVFRHLPISTVHPQAQLAAEAAEAAAAQGKFWEMHNALFENDDLSRRNILHLAEEIGLDLERFREELDNHIYADRVAEDFESGIRSGVNRTPTFFVNGRRYDGAWDLESLLETLQKPLGARIKLLSQEFAQITAAGGIVLLFFTILALIFANSSFESTYTSILETQVTLFEFGGSDIFHLSETLLHWVNDGLMVIFFFVVGLEIKREIQTGELANPRRAALPVAGALGGMIFPALLYFLFNRSGPESAGWGIPMATDIAFTLGILTVLGRRVPLSLKIFFTALAIADDLGAVLVIAIFYTSDIMTIYLVYALVVFISLVILNRARVYSPIPYAILGVLLWYCFLESGVHPTIAGVLAAITIPTRSPANLRTLLFQAVNVLESIDLPISWQDEIDSRRQAAAQTLETITDRIQSPAQSLEHNLQPISTYIILPIFALANAGIILSGDSFRNLADPVSLGILFGLVVGKPLGITAMSVLAVRLGLAEMPGGVSWSQFIGASCLAGIGFTMSLFITSSAFSDPSLQAMAKLSILIASLIAAVIGTIILLRTSPDHAGATELIPVVNSTDIAVN